MEFGATQLAGTIKLYSDGTTKTAVTYLFAQDLDKDGAEEVFIVGFESQPTTPETYKNTIINIFGWENGQLKNQNYKWLPGTTNQVGGVGDVGFGDFNGDGNIDVFLSAYTDMSHPVEAYVLWNNGQTLQKESLGYENWQHAVAVYDINNDGYDDIVTAGYASNIRYLGSPTGLTGYTGGPGSSGLAVGDFLNDGSVTAVYVDAGSKSTDTFLYSIEISENFISSNIISTLPGPRLENLNPFTTDSPYSEISSHDIRARSFDFNFDGLLDVVTFAYRYNAPSNTRHWSEIQFLANQGAGIFVDVTEQVLVGYDVSNMMGYYPQVKDFNLDGRLDIFTSNKIWVDDSINNGSSLLLNNEFGQFVSTDHTQLNETINSQKQGLLVRGPNNQLYLATEQMKLSKSSSGGTVIGANLDFDIYIQTLNFPERDNSENIQGSPSNDLIWGLGGNDSIFGGLGNDTIDGGIGIDVAVYTGSIFGYTLIASQSQFTVVDRTSNRDGTDTLNNIERLQFSDSTLQSSWFTEAGSLASNPATADAFDTLNGMYMAYFNRAPDATGLYYWASNVYQGQTFNQVAENFFLAPETQALYPSPITTQSSVSAMTDFINAVYMNVLNRTPDSEGFDYWLKGLQTGSSNATNYILQIIKAAVSSTGSPIDAAYFTTKGEVGEHFSITNGLTNVDQGSAVMDLFNSTYDGDISNLDLAKVAAKNLADNYLANVGSSPQLVVQLIGYDML